VPPHLALFVAEIENLHGGGLDDLTIGASTVPRGIGRAFGLSETTTALAPQWPVPPSHDEGEQFNGSKPDDQQCKRYRVVFEPNAHHVYQ
jgi:hypothetical protein